MAGSFGALAVLVAWLVSPFAQQIATFPLHSKESSMSAVNSRAMNFTMAIPSVDSAEPFVPVLPVKSAVYNGLFAEDNRPSSGLKVNCQTGNCTWGDFDTLGVCSSCVDMTPYLQQHCADGADSCGWQLPTGALPEPNDVFSMTTQVSCPTAPRTETDAVADESIEVPFHKWGSPLLNDHETYLHRHGK